MSQPEAAPAPGVNGPWPVLDAEERRVLGVLVEKAKTTPDSYPMSVNGLVTGANQKSNRDPLMELDEDNIESALGRLQRRGLVSRIVGSRVEKWRHHLYDLWHVDKLDAALLTELLLRGPQTEGELRTRASRMEPVEDLERLRAVLKALAERNLVVYLSPEEQRRGTVVTHGFHAPEELDALKRQHSGDGPGRSGGARNDEEVARLKADLTALREEYNASRLVMQQLQAKVAALEAELTKLKQALGA